MIYSLFTFFLSLNGQPVFANDCEGIQCPSSSSFYGAGREGTRFDNSNRNNSRPEIVTNSSRNISGHREFQELVRGRNLAGLDGNLDLNYININYRANGEDPNRARIEHFPWAMNYMPHSAGGMNWRWQSGQVTRQQDLLWNKFRTVQDIRNFLRDHPLSVMMLSPAEKYDLYRGDYNFSFSKVEWQFRGPRGGATPSWEGFCNGCRAAGISTPEPINNVEVINPDGFKITFTPTDIKALACDAYFNVSNIQFIGSNSSGRMQSMSFLRRFTRFNSEPVDPGLWDIALRSVVGEGRPFIFDGNSSKEKWNETTIGYLRSLNDLGNGRYRVVYNVEFLGEASVHKANGETVEDVKSGELTDNYSEENAYIAEIQTDGRGNISATGNRWVGKHPDFIWFYEGPDTYSTNVNLDYSVVRNLIDKSK